ncbi:MAG: hypothetical protein IPM98_15585 [Lewinellaceae bacterium]|nr:hypothetical protein [Lewinellaceae bacterium]
MAFAVAAALERKAKAGTLTVRTQPIRYTPGMSYTVSDRVVVPFSIENNGIKGQGNLRAVVKNTDSALDEHLHIPGIRSVLIPAVRAGARLEWGLPVRVAEHTPPGIYTLQVQFYQEDRPLGDPHSVEIHIGKRDGPVLKSVLLPPTAGLSSDKKELYWWKCATPAGKLPKGWCSMPWLHPAW